MISPVEIQIINKQLASVAEEMGILLQKSAFSPNIKERRDFSCAIFDQGGNLLSQAAHIPVHLGAMPETLKSVKELFTFQSGDIIITNNPFLGGTHLPDITLVTGVFLDDQAEASFYLVTRAHHADVGGITPGSMPVATSLDQEGVLIEPGYLARTHQIDNRFLKRITDKMRNREERMGDLKAQIACLDRGRQRLKEIVARDGTDTFYAKINPLLDYGERVMRAVLSDLPDGEYDFSDYLDDDGAGSAPVPITVKIRISGSSVEVDFSETADQLATGLNTVRSVTKAATLYCFFCLLGSDYPINAGSLRPIRIITRRGSLLDAMPPAPVAAGNVETSQRIVDCVLGALAQAIPGNVPAASCGSMNNIAIGGKDEAGRDYTYYETIGGGMGGRPGADGLSGIQVHMTNTLNTPVEALEQAYPFLIERYALRCGSGGKGKFRGGEGIIRAYRFLRPATVTLLTERRRLAPYGLSGGEPGAKGENILVRSGKYDRRLPGKGHFHVEKDDLIEIRTPGGGGWGKYNP